MTQVDSPSDASSSADADGTTPVSESGVVFVFSLATLAGAMALVTAHVPGLVYAAGQLSASVGSAVPF